MFHCGNVRIWIPLGSLYLVRTRLITLAAISGLLSITPCFAGPQFTIRDINPDVSTSSNPPFTHIQDARTSTAGRINGLARVALDNQVFYAATEWGGLYKTTDGGESWGRLDGHLPVATWDVKVDPLNDRRVYAT